MLLILTLCLFSLVRAAVNEPCMIEKGQAGVCISTSACSASGGTSVAGGCPGDPANVRCCTKPSCGKAAVDFNALNEEQMPISAATAGNCRWQNDCAGKSEAGLCPGPSRFRCCDSASNGWGGYSKPIEHYGGCQKVAIDGAKAAIKAWPGRVREVFCKRTCRDSSDHCDGKATDLMISDGSSVPTINGWEIAEWAMNNRERLNLRYVIWGQRIWNTERRDDKVKPWSQWRDMEDEGDLTANHWDHVHVSYK